MKLDKAIDVVMSAASTLSDNSHTYTPDSPNWFDELAEGLRGVENLLREARQGDRVLGLRPAWVRAIAKAAGELRFQVAYGEGNSEPKKLELLSIAAMLTDIETAYINQENSI